MTTTGWGGGPFGSSPWGYGGHLSPTITPLSPLDGDLAVAQSQPLSIRLSDDVGISAGTLRVTVSGIDLVLHGAAVNGATLAKTANSENGYDIVVTPVTPYSYGSRQEVFVSIEDIDGESAELIYMFHAGVGLRLLQVRNPMENILLAHFNKAMALNDEFYLVGNWRLSVVSADAEPLEIVEVAGNARQPDVAHLRYVGGGSTYVLTAHSLTGQDGEGLALGYDSAEFDLVYGDEEAPTIRLFDSVYGPLGISQQLRRRRTMDDHAADRSIALALDEQFRLRLQQLDGTQGRTGKPGIRRT